MRHWFKPELRICKFHLQILLLPFFYKQIKSIVIFSGKNNYMNTVKWIRIYEMNYFVFLIHSELVSIILESMEIAC